MVASFIRFSRSIKTLQQIGLGNLGLGIAIATGSLVCFAQPGLALSEEELYALCSKYPHNTQCEGYDIPIPLSRRDGETGLCDLTMAGESVTDVCKVALGDLGLTAYVEVGDRIGLMDDQRRTQVYEIANDSIVSLAYSEDESVNSERLARNIFLFGLLGAAFTEPDRVSQVEIGFVEVDSTVAENMALSEQMDMEEQPLLSEEASEEVAMNEVVSEDITAEEVAVEATPTEAGETTAAVPSSLTFESGRTPGAELRDAIESATGVVVQIRL